MFAGFYLIYLFFSNVFLSSDIEKAENGNDNKNNNFRFLRVVALLSITDFAFSIDECKISN